MTLELFAPLLSPFLEVGKRPKTAVVLAEEPRLSLKQAPSSTWVVRAKTSLTAVPASDLTPILYSTERMHRVLTDISYFAGHLLTRVSHSRIAFRVPLLQGVLLGLFF